MQKTYDPITKSPSLHKNEPLVRESLQQPGSQKQVLFVCSDEESYQFHFLWRATPSRLNSASSNRFISSATFFARMIASVRG